MLRLAPGIDSRIEEARAVLAGLDPALAIGIGIRMALGAARDEVTRMVVGQGVRPALWGIAVGYRVMIAIT
jgi:hypothetical protein